MERIQITLDNYQSSSLDLFFSGLDQILTSVMGRTLGDIDQ